MNTKLKSLLLALGFIALILIANFGYNYLAKNNKADQLATPNTTPSQQGNTSNNNNDSTSQPAQESKTKAPDFTVYDKDGNSVNLSSFFGKPIVLNFWASWCGPCKSEMPDFNQAHIEYGDEVTFLMVNMTDGARETQEKAQKYVDEQGFTMNILFDSKMDAATVYGVQSIPTSIFIDKDGYIVTGAMGAIDRATLDKGIELAKAQGEGSQMTTPKVTTIDAKAAKEMIDTLDSENRIILDVRTQSEYDEGHIEGAILIPDSEIAQKAEELLTDKDKTILVYCRSGRRSALASEQLAKLGYTNVYDFGGIIDWPYDIVK